MTLRHFAGLLLGLIVTGVLLVGGGWAVQQAVGSGPGAGTVAGGQKLWIALGVMAAIGLLVGLVVGGRVSPLATFVPSMALLAWSVVYALDVNRALSLIPTETSVHQVVLEAGRGNLTLLTTGVYALLGVAMFLPVLMPSRWASRRGDEEDYEENAEGAYY